MTIKKSMQLFRRPIALGLVAALLISTGAVFCWVWQMQRTVAAVYTYPVLDASGYNADPSFEPWTAFDDPTFNRDLAYPLATGLTATSTPECVVSTWTEFVSAYHNAAISKINLAANIDAPTSATTGTLNRLRRSLEIHGRGYTLYLEQARLNITQTAADFANDYVLNLHDVHAKMDTPNLTTGATNNDTIAFVEGDGGYMTVRIGNLVTNLTEMHHLAVIPRSLLIFYNKNKVVTTTENAHVGAVIWEDDCEYYGSEVGMQDYSLFYFILSIQTNTTGGRPGTDGCVRVGKRAKVILNYSDYRQQNAGTSFGNPGGTYPAFYSNYGPITVDEGATLAATMRGNAIRFDNTFQSLVVKRDATLVLTSLNSARSTLNYNAQDCSFIGEPGSNVYIVGFNSSADNYGSSYYPVVRLYHYRSQFILDEPASFDIRNRGTGVAIGGCYYPTAYNSTNAMIMRIQNTDISLWNRPSNITSMTDDERDNQLMGAADIAFMRPDGTDTYLEMKGRQNNNYYAQSSWPELDNGNVNPAINTSGYGRNIYDDYRRISGSNGKPEVSWIGPNGAGGQPTDADKFVKMWVITGYTPDKNGFDADGNANWVPVYSKGTDCEVQLTSSDGALNYPYPSHPLNSANLGVPDGNGLVMYPKNYPTGTLPNFLKAGSVLSATVIRGGDGTPGSGRQGDPITSTVLDVTPPSPAVVNNLSPLSTNVTGTGEPGAKVSIAINNTNQLTGSGGDVITVTIGADGTFDYPLPGGLTLAGGDVVYIYLTDAVGNQNPDTVVTFHDATFPVRTSVTVMDLPVVLHLRQVINTSASSSSFPRTAPSVGLFVVEKRTAAATLLETVNTAAYSGISAPQVPFRITKLKEDMETKSVRVTPLVPQYYRYVGYKAHTSASDAANDIGAVQTGAIALNVSTTREYWLTLYLEPIPAGTSLYQGILRENDFGVLQ
ncbi:MAG: Ig-like domain-containing protein [Oscillospiraceae bacterium]|jgi:hypothetical protein|nr:Ig-like domain-containing protein [Oscillospiraceae bacterium]